MYTFLNKTVIIKLKSVTEHQIKELKALWIQNSQEHDTNYVLFNIVGILSGDVKHAQSFEADRNMIKTLSHYTISPSTLTRSLSNNTNSCYKVHHGLYNIHQQHRLLVLQHDCFHIKIYKRRSPRLVPSSTQGLTLNCIHFLG